MAIFGIGALLAAIAAAQTINYPIEYTVTEPIENEDGSLLEANPIGGIDRYEVEVWQDAVDSGSLLNSQNLAPSKNNPDPDSVLTGFLDPVAVAPGDQVQVRMRSCDAAQNETVDGPQDNCSSTWAVSGVVDIPDADIIAPNPPSGFGIRIYREIVPNP